MHEFGLAEGVLETVRRRAAGRPVRVVRLRAGVRHGVDEAAMAQAFQIVAQGTEAEGATLELVTVPAQLTCRRCGRSAETFNLLDGCPDCGDLVLDLTGGDDLVLESLTYAVAGA